MKEIDSVKDFVLRDIYYNKKNWLPESEAYL